MAPVDVNSDVFSEILSRSDLKTMRMCRILSREHNRLTYESSFMQSHKDRTKTVCGYLIQSLTLRRNYSTFLDIENQGDDDGKLRLDFLPAYGHVKILASVDIGLFFCRTNHPENQHYICKPTTRQWEPMPSPNPDYFEIKIAMIVSRLNPLRFKIVCLSDTNGHVRDHVHKRIHCEIFDSNIWAWKRSKDLMFTYDKFFNSSDAISASGGVHWVISDDNKHKVLSFHQDKESWELISIPNSCNDADHRSISLAAYEGRLAILSRRRDVESVEIWTMKSRKGTRSWDKIYSIDLSGLKEEIGNSFRVVSLYDADTILVLDVFRAMFYNFKTNRSRTLHVRNMFNVLVSFVQTDYEPIQLRSEKEI